MNQVINKINHLNSLLYKFKTSIDTFLQYNHEYVKGIKRYESKTFEMENIVEETNEERKNKAETMMDQIQDIKTRNKLLNQHIELIIQQLIVIQHELMIMKNDNEQNEKYIDVKYHNLIEIVEKIIDSMQNEEIRKLEKEKHQIEMKYSQMKASYHLENENNENKNFQNEIKQIMTENEMKQIHIWTNLECREIVFDSQKDNWSIGSSSFNQKIKGKKQLLFLIENTNQEKFGYFLNTNVFGNNNQWIQTDKKSFEFNLKSNGRLEIPLQFEIINTIEGGYKLMNKNDEILIQIGSICLYKANKSNKSHCNNMNYFDYYGIEKALSGNIYPQTFTPKQFFVIQMN